MRNSGKMRYGFLIFIFMFLFTTACSSGGQVDENSPVVGEWKMAEITAGSGQVSAEEYREAAHVSQVPVLTFEKDGTVTLDMDGTAGAGTWMQEGDGYVVVYKRGDNETSVQVDMQGSSLVMEQDGYTLTYEKR